MKWTIKLLIIALVICSIFYLFYIQNPQYKASDLYEVSGACIDIRKESHGNGKFRFSRTYIVMEDGKNYYITEKLWQYIHSHDDSIIGEHVSFFASNKVKSFYQSPDVVAWNDNEENLKITFEMTNDENFFDFISSSTVASFLPIMFLLPDILKYSQKRYEKKLQKISEENKAIRRAKKQAKREYFNNPDHIPDRSNASKKRKR